MLCAPAMGWLAACAAETPASDSSTEGPCHASPSSARLSCSSSRLTSEVIGSTQLPIGLTAVTRADLATDARLGWLHAPMESKRRGNVSRVEPLARPRVNRSEAELLTSTTNPCAHTAQRADRASRRARPLLTGTHSPRDEQRYDHDSGDSPRRSRGPRTRDNAE